MLLGLSKIIDCPGASVPFSTSVDLSDLCFGVSYPVSEPVKAEGQVRNTAGVLVMTGSIQTTIHGICDRCANDFDRETIKKWLKVFATPKEIYETKEESLNKTGIFSEKDIYNINI